MPWEYDVFISHAGEDKAFAQELRDDLKELGIHAFVDKEDLRAADTADDIMLRAARTAPIGLAIFSREFFAKSWPMRELHIISERNTLLPVLTPREPTFTHDELEEHLKKAAKKTKGGLSKEEWDDFMKKVLRTTHPEQVKEAYTRPLRCRLCLDVIRLLVEKTCPRLGDSKLAEEVLRRVLNAVREVMRTGEGSRFPKILAESVAAAKDWEQKIKKLRFEHTFVYKITRTFGIAVN